MSEPTKEQQDKIKADEKIAREIDNSYREDYTVAPIPLNYETDEALADYLFVIANETRLARLAAERVAACVREPSNE